MVNVHGSTARISDKSRLHKKSDSAHRYDMSSTFLSLHYHVVFSTKHRQPLLHESWRPLLHQYLGGTLHSLHIREELIGMLDKAKISYDPSYLE
jgi:hypothetical protein